jgi:hypothetical protein
MTRFLAILTLALSTACGQIGVAPSTDSLIGSLRKGYSSPSGLVNGISEATLYPGYWTGMSEAIVHDPGVNDVSATQLDPLQTSYTWMADTVTNDALWKAQLELLRTEWGSASKKYAGAVTYTYYVDWANGDNSGAGTSEDPWKTIEFAAEYVQANRLDGSNYLDATTKIVLKSGIHYIGSNADHTGTGAPPGGRCTVRFDSFIGASDKWLIVAGETGDSDDVIVRIDHDHLASYADAYAAGDYISEFGIQINGSTD